MFFGLPCVTLVIQLGCPGLFACRFCNSSLLTNDLEKHRLCDTSNAFCQTLLACTPVFPKRYLRMVQVFVARHDRAPILKDYPNLR